MGPAFSPDIPIGIVWLKHIFSLIDSNERSCFIIENYPAIFLIFSEIL